MSEMAASQALVLGSIRWKESSKITTLYSREWGKIKVIARGAFRNKSPFAGSLESLNLINAIVSLKGSRSLQILTEADIVTPFSQLRMDMDRLPYALAILELIHQLFDEQQADEVFFDFTVQMIRNLSEARSADYIFWYFLLKLSSFLGFKPGFSSCLSCKKTALSGDVYFSVEQGTVYCSDCAMGSRHTLKLSVNQFRFLRRLQSYPHRKIIQFDGAIPKDSHITDLLRDYLNFHTEQTITLNSLTMLG